MHALRRGVVLALLVAFCATVAVADTLMVKKISNDAYTMMGQQQPAKEETQKVWIGSDRMAMHGDETSVILRRDSKKLYLVMHDQKVVYEADLPFDLMSTVPPQMAEMMRQQMQLDVEVTPTEENKELDGYQTKRYDVVAKSPMTTVSETHWVTKEIELDTSVYFDMLAEVEGSMQPAMKDMREKMSTIDGVPVMIEREIKTPAGVISGRETLVSFEEKDAPEGTYEPPAEYTVKPYTMQSLMEMSQGGGGM